MLAPESSVSRDTKSLGQFHLSSPELVKRLRALTLKLLPVEVDLAQLTEPTSRFISPQVIQAYVRAAGDFSDAVSSLWCL